MNVLPKLIAVNYLLPSKIIHVPDPSQIDIWKELWEKKLESGKSLVELVNQAASSDSPISDIGILEGQDGTNAYYDLYIDPNGDRVDVKGWDITRLHHTKDKIQELIYLAEHDGLTGLLNKNAFMKKALSLYNTSRRAITPLSLLMIDIDYFKAVNDTHGHQAGDVVLSELASTLMANTRKTDLVGRYGGEEFIIMLPNMNERDLIEYTEGLMKSIRNMVVIHDQKVHRLTVSIGGYTYTPGNTGFLQERIYQRGGIKGSNFTDQQPNESELYTMIGLADANLLAAKKTGRNQAITR